MVGLYPGYRIAVARGPGISRLPCGIEQRIAAKYVHGTIQESSTRYLNIHSVPEGVGSSNCIEEVTVAVKSCIFLIPSKLKVIDQSVAKGRGQTDEDAVLITWRAQEVEPGAEFKMSLIGLNTAAVRVAQGQLVLLGELVIDLRGPVVIV